MSLVEEPKNPQQRLEELESAAEQRRLLPGMAVIALYLLVVSAAIGLGVVNHAYPPLYLLLSGLFAVGSIGLLRMWRVGWALAMGGAVVLVAVWLWMLNQTHQLGPGMMAFLNAMIFFYLVRADVRRLLR